jgi:hypothetical protein
MRETLMDGHTFNNALRSLAQSRRSLLTGAFAVATGFGLGGLHLADAVEAKDKHKGKKKNGTKRKNKKKDQNQNRNQTQNPPVDTPPPPPPPLPEAPPPPSPPPPPARQVVTLVFSSSDSDSNLIPGSGTSGPASIYPSTIEVSGFTNGVILDLNVILTNLRHQVDRHVDILLAARHLPGRNATIMADAGGQVGIDDVDLVLDDADAFALPANKPITTGSFRPTNYGGTTNVFAAPAPAPTGNSALSTFNGQNPNGTWELFVMDDSSPETGRLRGWGLQITAEVDV